MKVIGNIANEKRRDKRLTGRPLSIEFDDQRHTVAEWSMGGFLIDTYDGDQEAGTFLPAIVHIEAGEMSVARPVKIEITRIDHAAHTLAARFVDLEDETYSMLERWVAGRAPRRDT